MFRLASPAKAAVIQRHERRTLDELHARARTSARALTAGHPRTMYLTGKDARLLALLSRLPAPVLDAAKRRVFGLPSPGSLAVAPAAR